MKPKYCTNPEAESCDMCSLTNYGMDCANIPLEDPIRFELTMQEVNPFFDIFPERDEEEDDDYGIYAPRGHGEYERVGSTCSCEDYPCCGH